MTKIKTPYHHGDLKAAIIKTASKMLDEQGIEALSLRKIAEKVGVSRTAAYHHFKDKNELLSAIASQGFILWQKQTKAIFDNKNLNHQQQLTQFCHGYIKFSINNPNTYDLMFGRTLWKDNASSDELKKVAYPSFEHQVTMTKYWQEKGILPPSENSLRLAQVLWGTLHGIAKLVLDGIYTDNNNISEMCDCAIALFINTKTN
ncbi:TetR/AcrR family transcriptional regulator [Thalassotalea profundi]|uniref:TetR family transcriptional regulator n=1 Tax=Thalassotalea profundi TaxID=2036687 RepID=A0ABQ3IDW3_9GAMM|nr:TetR/AcrR family transcriptional regulator [Thalassotalea profundi]GHE79951.1 TetR family transcriptional regulator [Thalassotalea profundi]